ncbi:MAG: branched-chain amino acid ABC transporter permease [Chloroflexi bacterium]|nr:branched-chain amino acid ABC transporter permease [Chloroflexota bacterium]
MTTFIQYLVDGLGVGCLYVLLATGFTLIFGVMGIMNVAHADFYMAAVFTYLFATSVAHLGVIPALLVGVLIAGALGAVLFFGVLDRIDHGRPLALFTATLGVSYVLENFIAKVVQFQTKSIPALFQSQPLTLLSIRFTSAQLVLLAVTLLMSGGLTLWLRRATLGKFTRAVSENTTLAELVAIDTRQVRLVAVMLAAAMAGFGGLLVANTSLSINPFVADTVSLKMFAVAVVAGIGSVEGAVVVGLLLGMIESVTVGYGGSQWQNVSGLLAMVLVLMVRPNGLFGRERRIG